MFGYFVAASDTPRMLWLFFKGLRFPIVVFYSFGSFTDFAAVQNFLNNLPQLHNVERLSPANCAAYDPPHVLPALVVKHGDHVVGVWRVRKVTTRAMTHHHDHV